MLSIDLPEEIEARLERLAERTGRSKSFYVREAVLEKIEDMEDVYLAEKVLERVRRGEEQILSAEDMWRAWRIEYADYSHSCRADRSPSRRLPLATAQEAEG